jgi:hypothetical protein
MWWRSRATRISASHDRIRRLWDLAAGATLCVAEGHSSLVTRISTKERNLVERFIGKIKYYRRIA